jgi:hypothetical protein
MHVSQSSGVHGRLGITFAALFALTLGGALASACGSSGGSTFGDDGGSGDLGGGGGGPGGGPGLGGDGGPCKGLACQQVACGGNVTTTVSGVVNAPNGTLPLYNAIVFVPNAKLDPLAEGASCDHCGSVSGDPLVATLTDANGKFVLKNVPVGKDIPLVVQVGKWRREITLPSVAKCVDNPITDHNLTRLPKNQAEGHIPRIAITTGWCDQLACLLPKLGLDASEFTANTGSGRLHLYRGAANPASKPVPAPAPAGTPDATTLWADEKSLSKYDMVMLSCECGEHQETKPAAAKQAMYDYSSAGGRVFASHFHYVWGNQGALASTAQWIGAPNNPENPAGPYLVDTTFPKGKGLAEWLVNVGATTKPGEIPISQPREDVGKVVAPTQRWVYRKRWAVQNVIPDPIIPESAMYMSVNTPVGKPVDNQCGKFVFADMHLYGGDVQTPGSALPDDNYPASCSKTLTPEEKALAFLFFDLSSCIQDETKAPSAPVK